MHFLFRQFPFCFNCVSTKDLFGAGLEPGVSGDQRQAHCADVIGEGGHAIVSVRRGVDPE